MLRLTMRRFGQMRGVGWTAAMSVALACGMGAGPMLGQSCTTQAKMTPQVRDGLAEASLTLAKAVQAGDAAKVQSLTIAEFAASQQSFGATADLVHSTAPMVFGDTLDVTQVYTLDAKGRQPGATDAAEFSCPLSGTAAETDFSIPGLPPGFYGFAMVEATGAKPWLLAFLLRQDGSAWKMAGFYPRARTAAGHDGAWYWKTAYDDGKAKQSWLSWLYFGLADQLLRPANFVTSTRLDSLRAEQRTAAPDALNNGVSPDVPLALKAADGTTFQLTGLAAEGTATAALPRIVLHLQAASLDDAAAAAARNQAAARALVDAHPELRPAFAGVVVVAEAAGNVPVVTEQAMAQVP
jgi:hypothetical protein